MSQHQTLAELKAMNAGSEEQEDAVLEDGEQVEAQDEVEVNVNEDDQDHETQAEDEEGNEVHEEVEGWLLEESEDSENVPLSSHIGMRKKLKGELSEVKDERDDLKRQIQELQQAVQTGGSTQATKPEPKYDDYESDAEYQKAYMDWKLDSQLNQMNQSQQQQAQQAQQAEAQRKLSEAVDAHYNRAEELVKKHGIKAEVYQQADTNLRRATEEVLPGAGNASVDLLLSNLGEGSEKVAYALGKNPQLLNEYQSLLRADPSGFKAAMYLGQKKAELTMPVKRKSNAPKPGAQVKGDKSTTVSASKKKYLEAHKKGNTAEAFKIKRAAKKAGTDVSTWNK